MGKKLIGAIMVLILLIVACETKSPDKETAVLDDSLKEENVLPSDTVNADETTQEPEPVPVAVEPPAPVAEPEPVSVPEPKEEYQMIDAELIYPDSYNGPLYDTSLQIGGRGDVEKHFENFDRNGMNFFIGYFKIDFPPESDGLVSNSGLGFLLTAVQEHPYRVVPYTSLSYDAEDVPDMLGKEMTTYYKDNLAAIKGIAGDDLIKGFGELEIMDYSGFGVDSPELVQIYDLAAENNIWIMFHPKSGQSGQVKKIIEKYPGMIFLIHMFREDLSRDMDKYIDLMKTHDNLFFSIDAAHIIHINGNDILYSYYDDYGDSAASNFISTVNKKYSSMMSSAVSEYKPLVAAVPDKVMWGTEAGPDYAFTPEVYDLMIKVSREFITKVTTDTDVQEDLAYRNAIRVFGKGVKLEDEIEVVDGSAWPECKSSQISKCDTESDKCGDIDTPEAEQCFTKCIISEKCFETEEMLQD